jgi:hypothetical protein
MNLKSVSCAITAVLISSCLSPAHLNACPVSLQIQNASTFLVNMVSFRKHGTSAWVRTSPRIDPTNKIIVSWDDDSSGPYDMAVSLANAPDRPEAQNICDICAISQITILNDGINIKGNCQ